MIMTHGGSMLEQLISLLRFAIQVIRPASSVFLDLPCFMQAEKENDGRSFSPITSWYKGSGGVKWCGPFYIVVLVSELF